jgi:glycosyltransferase involved in cell wall biosynthesis
MRDKGVYDFLEAARRVAADSPGTRFSILGRAETFNPTGISESDITKLQLEYPVQFLAETTDVRPHLAASSVFVLPSYYREGLPRTILEAMATGRAVITTDTPGCRDPIEDGESGIIVPPRDVDALVAAMRSFVTNPDQAVKMGQRARTIAVQSYDVAHVNALLMEQMGLVRGPRVFSTPRGNEKCVSESLAVDPA